MRPRNPRPLISLPDQELWPKVLSHYGWHLFWTCVCIAVHVGSLFYIYGIEPEPFWPGYNRAVAAIIIGLFIFHAYKHLHLIWWPYYQEMRRRGGLPPQQPQKPNYRDPKILIPALTFWCAFVGSAPPIMLISFEQFSDNRAYASGVLLTFLGIPIWIGALLCGYFWHEEKKHVRS